MSLAQNRERSQKMAADLVRRGYPHGVRRTKPYPGSGGIPVNATGSAAYRRLQQKNSR